MIIALIILILLSGGLNAPNLDLSDPAVLAKFRQEVSTIIEDPVKAANVSEAVYKLNVVSFHTRSSEGVVEKDIKNFRSTATNYNSSKDEVHRSLKNMEYSMLSVNRSTIEGRDVIRRNTAKKEWKKLLKQLSK